MNPGVIRGGTRSNVVAAEAEAVIDLRVRKQADAERIGRILRALKPKDKRTQIEISGGIKSPSIRTHCCGRRIVALGAKAGAPARH